MSLSGILMVLKYVGTAISGAAGIWGTVSETHDKRTGKLGSWGRWALGLAIAGFAVALCSQIAEQIKDSRDAKEAEVLAKATEADLREQLDLARATSSSVLGVKTQFEAISAEVSLELPSSDPKVAKLIDELQSYAAASATPQGPVIAPKGAGALRGGTVFIDIGQINDPAMRQAFPSIQDFRQLFEALDMRIQYAVISKKVLPYDTHLDIARRDKGDIDAKNSAPRSPANALRLIYESSTRRLAVYMPGFVATSQDWSSSGRITGTSELPGAQFVFMFYLPVRLVTESAPLLNGLRMDRMAITFGTHTVKLGPFKSFVTLEGKMRALVCETTIPSD